MNCNYYVFVIYKNYYEFQTSNPPNVIGTPDDNSMKKFDSLNPNWSFTVEGHIGSTALKAALDISVNECMNYIYYFK